MKVFVTAHLALRDADLDRCSLLLILPCVTQTCSVFATAHLALDKADFPAR